MRFSAILLSAGFIALAAAQSASTTTASLSPTATCLAGCPSGDVTCQAACVGVPAPDASMVNATNDCAAACPQGNGTAAETQAFSDCVQACIKNEFYTSSAGSGASATATGTGTAATGSGSAGQSATGTGSSASASGTSGTSTRSGSGSTTGTETANASATASGNTAAGYTVTGSFIALFAVAAGIIVL